MNSGITERIVWLLREAGPHRACELAVCIGCPTADVERTLRALEREGSVVVVEVGASIKWRLRPSPAPAP